MNKLIFTTLRGRRLCALASDKRILQLDFEGEAAAEQIGTIYIGKVRNVVKNLNAAFVEYKPGINGYYSLNDNPIHIFADGRRESRPLKPGDEILVQVSRAAVKTKDAVLSGELTLTGRFAAVMVRDAVNADKQIGISTKIRDKTWREQTKARLADAVGSSLPENIGIIVRTNAYGASFDELWSEIICLSKKLDGICKGAAFRTLHSSLYRPDSFAVSAVRDMRMDLTSEIVTDLPEIYEELKSCGMVSISSSEGTDSDRQAKLPSLRFYEDSYPLASLYHLESSLERATGKTVWLKSGGYLVIEPTEAMTVIDVNTGKNIEKKTAEETYFKTNLEAAAEIAVQLRLRNLSGIIIIDFIDMNDENHREELLNSLKQHLASDPVKTTFVDMTALGLVEVTRKKIKKPLHEQMKK